MHIDSYLTPEQHPLDSGTVLQTRLYTLRHADMLIQSLRHERSLEAYDIPYLSNNIYIGRFLYNI